MPRPSGKASTRTLVRLITLATLVAALHLWLTGNVLDEMAGLQPDAPGIARMQTEYVAEVRLTQPPAAPAVAPAVAPVTPAASSRPKKKKPPRPPQPASAASAPEASPVVTAASSPDEPAPIASSPASAPDVAVAESPREPASAAKDAGTQSAGAEPFVWPQATRVSYIMEGFYRGPLHGQSSVEWIRKDQRYQVHIDASVGPSFAPLGSWRLSSEGDIRPEGLHPRRYENVNRLLIRGARARVMELGDEWVTMPDGKQQARTAGLQDPASFMIQVAYQFILDPSKARPGSSFEMTVLTLRKPELLVFDVIEEVPQDTPMGRIQTLHVRPRKAVVDDGALPADVWFAPGLQYLPVRIAMKMKDDVWLDMKMSRAPQQAPAQAGEGASAGASGAAR